MEMEEKLPWRHNGGELLCFVKEEPVSRIKEVPIPNIKEEPFPSIKDEPVPPIREEPVLPIKEESVLLIKQEPVPQIIEVSVPRIKEEPVAGIKEEPIIEAMVFSIKEEPEWLTEDFHTQLYQDTVNQEYKPQMDALLSIKTEVPITTEAQHFHAVAEPSAVIQPYSQIPKRQEPTKTEMERKGLYAVLKDPDATSGARENENCVIDEKCDITIAGDEWEICSFCYKLFPKESIDAHRIEQHRDKTYECEVCYRTFNRKTSLLRHSNVHKDIRGYACGQCHRTFSESMSLKRHQLTHDQERKPEFCCTVCGNSYLSKSGLQGHMKVHASNTYPCAHCGVCFKSQQNLRTHVLICHAEKKPCNCEPLPSLRYKCDQCDKTYGSTKALSVHSKEHIGFPWKCRLCQKKFHVLSRVRGHIKKVHKIVDKGELQKFEERISIS